MTTLQKQSKTRYFSTFLPYLPYVYVALLPVYAGNIFYDTHTYLFGTHINYLHLRLTLHTLLSVAYLLYEASVLSWSTVKSNVFLKKGTFLFFLLLVLTSVRAYITSNTYSQTPEIYAATAAGKFTEYTLCLTALVLSVKRILSEDTRHYLGSFILGVSSTFQLFLSFIQVQIRGPLYPTYLSWTGQPISFTSFSYIDTHIFYRAYGTTPHPNILGGIFCFMLVLILALKLPKFVKALLVAGIMGIILLTLSRSAITTMTIVLLVYVLKGSIEKTKVLERMLYGLQYFVTFFLTQGALLVAFSKIPATEYSQTFLGSRAHIQSLYMEYLEQYPAILLFGTGFTQAIPGLLSRRLDFDTPIYYLNRLLAEPPHNALLLTIVEFGLPLSIGLWILFLFTIRSILKKQPAWIKLSTLLLIIILGGVDHYLVY